MGRKSGDMDYAMELKADYQKWFTIWKQGWSDPNYPDGTGLNGARGRIMREKKELEKTDGELPEEYHWLLPPEVPEDFMARTKELWYGGIRSYLRYLADEDYQYLCQVKDSLSREIIKHSSIENVIGYVQGIKYALEHKDFLTLRRHENPERYLESFQQCRERIGEMLLREKKEALADEKGGQLNLFQMGMSQKNGVHR